MPATLTSIGQHPAPRFAHLPKQMQGAIAQALRPVMRSFAGGSYDAVQGQTARQRAPSVVEFGGEDDILNSFSRGKLTNMMRQQMRNSPIARTIDQQIRVNVVGDVGGKLQVTTPDDKFNAAVQVWFNTEWAPKAEFTDSIGFNEMLKLARSSVDNGGDFVAVFDDGLFDDSGRIRAFESDEIANLRADEFKLRFEPRGWKQCQGRISDRYGRTLGCVVSTAQRGRSEFDPEHALVLVRDLAEDPRDSFFVYWKANWRFNQGRGVSARSAAINTLVDIYELLGSETQSAKLNAKLFGQLVDSAMANSEPSVPTDFRPSAEDPNGEAEPTDGLTTPQQLADAAQPAVSFDGLDAIGAVYDMMPQGLKWELIDTKRPNEKIIDYINWNAGMATGVHGLGRIYATLNPEASYTAFRGAQCLSWPSIEEAQKDLERKICDWAARAAIRWGLRQGVIPGLPATIPAGWWNAFSWQWPEMREVNEVDAQTAFQKSLANLTQTYRAKFGPNWRDQLTQAAEEIDWCRERGILHPALQTTSGGLPTATTLTTKGTQK